MVDSTQKSYGYAGDDPINSADPSGLDYRLRVERQDAIDVGFSLWVGGTDLANAPFPGWLKVAAEVIGDGAKEIGRSLLDCGLMSRLYCLIVAPTAKVPWTHWDTHVPYNLELRPV